jgi:hypothetical protein
MNYTTSYVSACRSLHCPFLYRDKYSFGCCPPGKSSSRFQSEMRGAAISPRASRTVLIGGSCAVCPTLPGARQSFGGGRCQNKRLHNGWEMVDNMWLSDADRSYVTGSIPSATNRRRLRPEVVAHLHLTHTYRHPQCDGPPCCLTEPVLQAVHSASAEYLMPPLPS